jgi:hypothetical protein
MNLTCFTVTLPVSGELSPIECDSDGLLRLGDIPADSATHDAEDSAAVWMSWEQ